MQLLLIEDDPTMRATLERSLTRAGMRVQTCGDGAQALAVWQRLQPDAVLLDLNLPGLDGLEVLKRARAAGLATPVVILTARGTVGDRVLGLNLGADDYLPKPFDLDELEARLRALYRRQSAERSGRDESVQFGPLRYDRDEGPVYLDHRILELPLRELQLLRALMCKPGHALARERLFEIVFPGEAQVQPEAIEVVVYRLRKKLAGTGLTLMTLRGVGYLLKLDA
ncbi:two-component system response regulator [Rhodoferax lacus]|uniref:Two-component system response regulator n=1 Tax=Rhodoferax lacus TaxID=2184758 RepID=A0A3E1R983_9BURK|nr:response regulator transcription factor [Rhodoferax lacus]RFO95915.1 two-component system response regulator [Rhodoferax lacus]